MVLLKLLWTTQAGPALLLLLFLFSGEYMRPCLALTSSSSSCFASFRFAPNGVCIQPRLFVDASSQTSFTMRNVPGEGDCMFLAVALATFTSVGLGANDVLLRAISRETRSVVASILESPTGNLVIAKTRLVPAQALLQSASKQEGLSPKDYLALLRKEGLEGGLYGGGPELTVLSNVLRRPISIYELAATTNDDTTTDAVNIECKGTFGAENFPDPLLDIPDSAVLSRYQQNPGAYSWHIHILVVNVSQTEKHACVLLPQQQS
jgi:hypothetical protein